MKMFRPSRSLNEKGEFMGLGYSDLIGLTSFLLLAMMINNQLNLFNNVFLVLVTGVFAIILSPIRLKHRRFIIRDYFSYTFNQRGIFKDGNSRNH